MLDKRYYLIAGNRTVGPAPSSEILAGIRAGRVPPTSLVCEVHSAKWTPIGDVPEFSAELHCPRPGDYELDPVEMAVWSKPGADTSGAPTHRPDDEELPTTVAQRVMPTALERAAMAPATKPAQSKPKRRTSSGCGAAVGTFFSSILVLAAILVLASAMLRACSEEQQAQQRAEAVRVIDTDTRAALEAALALEDPCLSAAAVWRATPDDQGAELQDIHDRLSSALEERGQACCEQRMTRVRHELAALPETDRSGPVSRMLNTIRQDETTVPTLNRCGATGTMEMLEQALLLEQGLERSDTSSWRAYLRVREMDVAGPADLVTLLFPPERRGELAQHCIDGGLGAAQRADDPREALRMIEEVEQCAAAPELTVSASDRNRVMRAHRSQQSEVAALQRREEREAAARDRERNAAEAQALREIRRRPGLREEQEDIWACTRECRQQGGAPLDCIGLCAETFASPTTRCLAECSATGREDGECALRCR